MAVKDGLIVLGVAGTLGTVVLVAVLAGIKIGQESKSFPVVTPSSASERRPPPATTPYPINPSEPSADSAEPDPTDQAALRAKFDAMFDQLVKQACNDGVSVLVSDLAGNGSEDSSDFTVTSPDQIFEWAVLPSAMDDISFRVVSASTRQMVDFAMPGVGKAGGASRFHLDPGTYYLKVSATSHWRIAVFDLFHRRS